MPSDAMQVWRGARDAYNKAPLGSKYDEIGHEQAAAVIDRAIADAMAEERARIERLKGYAVHDDTCEDHGAYPGSCTCGLSRLLKEIGDASR